MAFLRVRRIKGCSYHYIVQSVRRGGKVTQKILEYLGRDPDPVRLKQALAYWRVEKKPRRPGKGRRKDR